jgi:hypothetical protein
MNAKQQLAYNLNKITCDYLDNKNIRRFYKKITYFNSCIAKNTDIELFKDYKSSIKIVYDNIINDDDDETIINDSINIIRQIILGLLFFE